jgi:hypothetical protein
VAAVAYSVMLACALLASYMPGKQSSNQSEQARRIETCEIWKMATRWQPTTRQRQHDQAQQEGMHMSSGGRRQERSTVSTASLAARDGRCEVPAWAANRGVAGRVWRPWILLLSSVLCPTRACRRRARRRFRIGRLLHNNMSYICNVIPGAWS